MIKKSWTEVSAGASAGKLPAGGYVIGITDVEDVPARSYLNLGFDVAEGPERSHFADEWGCANPWAHRFVRSYKPNCEGMFRSFLQRLQDSNPGFDIEVWQRECDEHDFVGLKIGAVLQYEDYTNQYGEDKERLVVTGIYSADYIRQGKFKVPPRIDKRDRRAAPKAAYGTPAPRQVPGGIAFDPKDPGAETPFA